MTEVELVAAALAAGASAGLTDTAREAVRDLYARLRDRLAGKGDYGVRVLDAHESDPDAWGTRLTEVLTGMGLERDEEILATSRRVLLGAERRLGAMIVDARGARGVLNGDHSTQNNTFN
ncbi:hypothetical protein ACWEWI_03350 [Streptomyces sp. NPDC003753]